MKLSPLAASVEACGGQVRVHDNCRRTAVRHHFRAVLRWLMSMALTRNGGLMTACRQPDCTGTVVDGYCDVCGSPAGAAPFVLAEVAGSAGSPSRGESGLAAVHRGS